MRKAETLAGTSPAQPSIKNRTRWAMVQAWLRGFSTATALLCLSGWVMAQAGQLDATFGTGGIFVTRDSQSFDAAADAVVLQGDGKIVVAGEIGSLAGVLRLNINGTVDSSFGTGGSFTLTCPTVSGVEFR